MTLSKSTRAELRRRCPTPEETDALLDMADERDRYRAALEKIATGRITGEQKHSEYASELRARIAQEAIDAAPEGKNHD